MQNAQERGPHGVPSYVDPLVKNLSEIFAKDFASFWNNLDFGTLLYLGKGGSTVLEFESGLARDNEPIERVCTACGEVGWKGRIIPLGIISLVVEPSDT